MGMFTTEMVVSSRAYIFDGAGGMRDQLEQTILQVLEEKKFPYKFRIEKVSGTGGIWGTKEQCVTIEVSKNRRIAIANVTVGTYLYVTIYSLLKVVNNSNINTLVNTTDDIFVYLRVQAAFAAAVKASESAFGILSLKQTNTGYRPLLNSTLNDE